MTLIYEDSGTDRVVRRRNFAAPQLFIGQGVWGEEQTSDDVGSRVITFSRPIPVQLIESYAHRAVRHAVVEETEDGWYASIIDLDGVWACEPSVAEAIEVLQDVVEDWVLVKLSDGDIDIPEIDGLDLNGI